MLKLFWLVVWSVLLARTGFAATNEPAAGLLDTLRPSHPRLLVLDDQLARMRELTNSDTTTRQLYLQLQKEADKILREPPLAYAIGGAEHTLLDVSRNVEGRVWLLAGLYRLRCCRLRDFRIGIRDTFWIRRR